MTSILLRSIFTPENVEALVRKGGCHDYRDRRDQFSLHLRVHRTNEASWAIRYQDSGRVRWFPLGKFEIENRNKSMSLDEARRLAAIPITEHLARKRIDDTTDRFGSAFKEVLSDLLQILGGSDRSGRYGIYLEGHLHEMMWSYHYLEQQTDRDFALREAIRKIMLAVDTREEHGPQFEGGWDVILKPALLAAADAVRFGSLRHSAKHLKQINQVIEEPSIGELLARQAFEQEFE